MRNSVRLVLAALVSALTSLPGVAQAQYFAPTKATTGPSFNSYYGQASGESNYLTGTAESQAPAGSAPANCDSGDWCGCCGDVGTWRDNTLFWFGGEAYKSFGDTAQPPGVATGFMNSAGLVGGFNTGFALLDGSPIRGQVGASYGAYDLKGRDTISQSSSEQQTFITVGVYKRSDILADDRISWGLVYDQFWAHQWGLFASELYVGQVRGIAGYAVNQHHEFGVWGTFRSTGDNSVGPLSSLPLRAMNQYNVYWRYNWDFGGQTMLYVGGHDPADIGSWLFGLLGQAPLSDNTALYGNFTYAFPGSATGAVGANELEWNFGLGLVYSWGGKAVSTTVSGQQGLPLLPVANNGSFLITN